MNIIQNIQQFIRKYRLLQRDDKIVAAVSGGVDSVVMLDVLMSLREQWNLSLVVAHVNHQLRGEEADCDEEFVKQLAKHYGVSCYAVRVGTAKEAERKKISIQETARNLRYDFFSKLRNELGFHKVTTAHNANDNAETVLLNLSRGAGVQGLAGIPVMREDMQVVRLLLSVTREEIETYARERGLSYRTDSSNAKTDYTRNFLRHSVVPLFTSNVNPNFVMTLNRTAELFRSLEQYLNNDAQQVISEVAQKGNGEVVIDIPRLAAQPLFMQEYCLLLLMREFVRHDVDFSSVKTMSHLIEAETGSAYQFAQGVVAIRDRARLVFRNDEVTQSFRYPIEPNQFYRFDRFLFSSAAAESYQPVENGKVEFVDADRLGNSLVLRNWSEGDWFFPLGMKGRKKLSDFFVDAKIPIYEKQSIPVLESDGAIVWVCGKRIDDRFKVNKATKHILKLEYSPRTLGS